MQITKEDLLDLITEASYRLHTQIKLAYKRGRLKDYLSGIGMIDLFPCEEKKTLYDTNPDGKILIVGEGRVKEREIYGCLKEYGIDKERIELHLGYKEARNFSFRNIRYNPNYHLILFGPVPHSGEGKQENSSIITQIENDDGYLKVVRLTDGHGLKMTKTSLRKAIIQEVKGGYLAV